MGRRLAGLILGSLLSTSLNAAEPPITWEQAIHRGNLKRISALLPQQDPNIADKGGKTALMAAAAGPNPELFRALVSKGANINAVNSRGGNVLMYAALKGHPDIVGTLLEGGADVHQRGNNGWTALTIASAKGHMDTVRALLDAGADPNSRDVYGWTPLMRAVEHGRIAVVEIYLKEPSVDVDLPNVDGQTAEQIAEIKGTPEIIGLFLDR